MSWRETEEPRCESGPCDPVQTVIVPRARDLGDFEVRRALPARERQMVGPFIFFDHMGPTVLQPGHAVDVRPHPHIGLSTLTWLVEGEIHHRDSLGSNQVIRSGEVNWMTAGRGIVHSERTPQALRGRASPLLGLQVWCALPKALEETAPAFHHYPRDALPAWEDGGARVVLVAGTGWGARSPVAVASETVFADAVLEGGAGLAIEREHEERAIYVLDGQVEIGGQTFDRGQMIVLRPGIPIDVRAPGPAHLAVLGGGSMDGPRHLFWNLVSSSPERIEEAKRAWRAGEFPLVPGDEKEFIPLPD